jgi:hypothetical protein
MITLQANKTDVDKIIAEASKKAKGIQELSNPFLMKEFSDAIFTVTSKAFIKALNIQAKSKPKMYHHLYEWGSPGVDSKRLFTIEKILGSNKRVVIRAMFQDSKTPVPIPTALRTPGKTGRSVTKKNVFAKKAEIMESGRPVIYRTSKNTPLAIGGELKFVAARTLIKNFHPGGKLVKGSFQTFFNSWFASRAESIINSSGMLKAVQAETARVLNENGAGAEKVRTAVANVYKQYSKNEVII